VNRRHRLVEHAVAAHRLVVALAQAVQVHGPGEVRRRLEAVELALHQDRVRAQIYEPLARNQLAGDLVDLGMDEGLAAGDGDHRRSALLDRPDRLLDAHASAEHVVGMLDLPAAGAGQVALEQRLELDQERELLAPREPLAGQVGAHADALPERNGHEVSFLFSSQVAA
jgi:hypothetical protein